MPGIDVHIVIYHFQELILYRIIWNFPTGQTILHSRKYDIGRWVWWNICIKEITGKISDGRKCRYCNGKQR